MIINSARFVISNAVVRKCPKDSRHEYAFIGRSNVGKLSTFPAMALHCVGSLSARLWRR